MVSGASWARALAADESRPPSTGLRKIQFRTRPLILVRREPYARGRMRGHRHTVILVDDEGEMRDGLRDHLIATGVDVLCARHGRAALQLVALGIQSVRLSRRRREPRRCRCRASARAPIRCEPASHPRRRAAAAPPADRPARSGDRRGRAAARRDAMLHRPGGFPPPGVPEPARRRDPAPPRSAHPRPSRY